MDYEHSREFSVPKTQDGRTALHWAASSGARDIVQYLIGMKAQVDKQDQSGWTPLHIAGMHNCVACMIGSCLMYLQPAPEMRR